MRLDLPLLPFSILIRLEGRPRPASRPRLTIRALMIAIAALAAPLGGYAWLIHSPTELWAREYRREAEHHGLWEAYHRDLAALAARAGDPAEAGRHASAADLRRTWRRNYEIGLWTPWRTVMSAPSEPSYRTEPEPPRTKS